VFLNNENVRKKNCKKKLNGSKITQWNKELCVLQTQQNNQSIINQLNQ